MNLYLFVWSLVIVSTTNSNPLRSMPESFCRNDYLFIQTGNKTVFSVSSLPGKPTSNRVSRQELVRLEADDVRNQQWVIRTWDGGHLAINETSGKLTVKEGCVSTTFLRVVLPENLQDCFDGETCTTMLCATSKETGNSFMVAPGNKTSCKVNERGACETHKKFKEHLVLEELIKQSGFNATEFSFKFVPASSEDGLKLISSSLKRTCPRAFDPMGETRKDKCGRI